MPGPQFFETVMGHKFYEHDVPRAADALVALNKVLCRVVEEMVKKKTKVIVQVSGGCCQAVFSSDPNIEVELCDFDNGKVDKDAKKECARMEEECKGMAEAF